MRSDKETSFQKAERTEEVDVDIDSVQIVDQDVKDDVLYNSSNSLNKRNNDDKYTLKYRLLKTLLLILAWISFGLNFEMIGPTFEDLKIYLNINYSAISFGLILRNFGYMALTLVFGFVLDKVSHYSEALMAFSSAVVALTSFLIPITKVYILQMGYFFAQGLAQAIYDLGGNYIILNLWSGINTSPINAMHAGYGIGAIIAIQMSKSYIVFSQYDTLMVKSSNSTNLNQVDFNSTTTQTQGAETQSDKINLKVPYWFAGFFALFITFLFVVAQIYEQKIRKDFDKNRKQLVLLDNELEQLDNNSVNSRTSIKLNNFLMRLLFGNRSLQKTALIYLTVQLILIVLVFIFNQGFSTVITRFMLTYLVLGPAKFNVEVFVVVQTLFWSFFIFGRFLAAYLAFKIDSMKFYMGILVANLAVNLLFMIPILTSFHLFFWIAISLLGLTSGPMTPTGFMIAKNILDVNSLLLSLFIVGLAIGGILFQQITAGFLDFFKPSEMLMGFKNPNSSYIIPHVAFGGSFLCLLSFVLVYVLFVKFNRLVK